MTDRGDGYLPAYLPRRAEVRQQFSTNMQPCTKRDTKTPPVSACHPCVCHPRAWGLDLRPAHALSRSANPFERLVICSLHQPTAIRLPLLRSALIPATTCAHAYVAEVMTKQFRPPRKVCVLFSFPFCPVAFSTPPPFVQVPRLPGHEPSLLMSDSTEKNTHSGESWTLLFGPFTGSSFSALFKMQKRVHRKSLVSAKRI